jgi:hypothetical protein
MSSAERIQRIIPVTVSANFLDGSRHATLHRVALPQPVDQNSPTQRSEQFEQDTIQRLRVEVLDVQRLLQFPTQNLNYCPKGINAHYIDGIVR